MVIYLRMMMVWRWSRGCMMLRTVREGAIMRRRNRVMVLGRAGETARMLLRIYETGVGMVVMHGMGDARLFRARAGRVHGRGALLQHLGSLSTPSAARFLHWRLRSTFRRRRCTSFASSTARADALRALLLVLGLPHTVRLLVVEIRVWIRVIKATLHLMNVHLIVIPLRFHHLLLHVLLAVFAVGVRRPNRRAVRVLVELLLD